MGSAAARSIAIRPSTASMSCLPSCRDATEGLSSCNLRAIGRISSTISLRRARTVSGSHSNWSSICMQ